VILAYAAMWVIAAGFVLFLWRRQQALRSEIERLRRDLDAAAGPPPTTEDVPA
jgi:CcmD family protein